jgi:5,10-methylene-tetrahydrofolate dehydrogenase/methenyl tetrahydrofolate cyclohydrolase
MNNISEHQIEKLYDNCANTGVIVEQTINGLLRVFLIYEHHPDAEKWSLRSKLKALKDCGVDSTIIAAAIQATTTQMIANVDILNAKPNSSDIMRIYMKGFQPAQ